MESNSISRTGILKRQKEIYRSGLFFDDSEGGNSLVKYISSLEWDQRTASCAVIFYLMILACVISFWGANNQQEWQGPNIVIAGFVMLWFSWLVVGLMLCSGSF